MPTDEEVDISNHFPLPIIIEGDHYGAMPLATYQHGIKNDDDDAIHRRPSELKDIEIFRTENDSQESLSPILDNLDSYWYDL